MKRRKPGRPPTRSEDLVFFNAQMTTKARDRLKALAQIEGKHAYVLLEEAFWSNWQVLDAGKRKAAELIASTVEKARKGRA